MVDKLLKIGNDKIRAKLKDFIFLSLFEEKDLECEKNKAQSSGHDVGL